LVHLVNKPTPIKVGLLFIVLVILAFPSLQLPINTYKTNVLIVSNEQFSLAKTIALLPKNSKILIVNQIQINGVWKDTYAIPIFAALSKRPMYYEPEAADFSKSLKTEDKRRQIVDVISQGLITCSKNADKKINNVANSVGITHILIINGNTCLNSSPYFHRIAISGQYSLFDVKSL
jgi:hypothetical protein